MRTPTPFAQPVVPTLTRDLIALGVSRDRLRRAVAAGTLVRVRHGVYLGARDWPDDPPAQHLLRAVSQQLANPAGVVSHRSAARHWGLPVRDEDWAGEPVWLTVDSGRSESGPMLREVVAPLPAHHIVMTGAGCRVTTSARTAVDLATGAPLPEALMVLDAALRLECARLVVHPRRRDLANLKLVAVARQSLLEASRTLRRGDALIRAIEWADPIRESPIESLSFGHMILAGLPLPVCQAAVTTTMGTFFPDFYWQEQRLIGESDGRGKYEDSSARVREKEREQVLRDLDFRFVRWLGKEIHLTPNVVMARIERALAC